MFNVSECADGKQAVAVHFDGVLSIGLESGLFDGLFSGLRKYAGIQQANDEPVRHPAEI